MPNKSVICRFRLYGGSMIKEIMKSQPFTVRVYSTDVVFRKDGDVFVNDEYDLSVNVKLEEYEGTSAVRQINTITNNGKNDVVISGFSSAAVKTSRGLIGVDRCRWLSEGQWNFFTPSQCGLVPASFHDWERETYTIDSVGSWSTGVFYPLTVVIGEDGYSYFMEIEGAHNWQLKHMVMGGIQHPIYELEGTAAHEENGGWKYTLKPGESYTAQPAVFGRVKGGFEEVCGELVAYKRAVSKVHFKDNIIPLVFNDYMNCLWGQPTDKKLIPLIDAAADVGCEYFCIDAGWHKNGKTGRNGAAGDWIVDDSKFGEGGLAKIFAHMKEKGLVPGVWFEFDTVNSDAVSHEIDDDCLLKRYGKDMPRSFFNFANKKVREHLMSRINELYNMGVRYIKNDYNQTTGIGCDNDSLMPNGSSPAEGLIRNYEAFVGFIDEAMETHPGLIIENCGSGACRSDNGSLKHFYLQSTSDQEIYYNYPSIIIGSSAHMPPEKAGIWSYPMPLLFDERGDIDKFADDNFKSEWQGRFVDCEETIFNMVNGMCGNLYQSGHIEFSDSKNLEFVKEGISAYKKMRLDTIKAHPILPCGTCLIGDVTNTAYGLESPDKSFAYIAVWRIGTDDKEVEIDLSKYGYSKVSMFYPSFGECKLENGILKVKLPKKYSARMIKAEK